MSQAQRDSGSPGYCELPGYCGRLAPTPTGYLHLGHARTFGKAAERAAGGVLIFRDEDLDPDRCLPEYSAAALEDLRWYGLNWQYGPDVGGPHVPYRQSQRRDWYLSAWRQLHATGWIYPSPHSRKQIQAAIHSSLKPNSLGPEDQEPLFPAELRPAEGTGREATEPGEVNWRFRVPDDETITFVDGSYGVVSQVAGVDFGDFLVWRKDGYPAYEFSVVADDHAMGITEVVRGADLLTSTARQLLIYGALGWTPPAFFHCPLVCDPQGQRLAKRTQGLALRSLRERGITPEEIRKALAQPQLPAEWFQERER